MVTFSTHTYAGSPREVVRAVIDDIRLLAGRAEQSDGITMLCLRYFGSG